MRRTRLVLYREVFLSDVLSKRPMTILQGLHRRFPLIWSERDQYPFYKHMFFERPLVQEEYLLNLGYCLFEAANNEDYLFNVLFEELYKQEKKLYTQLKQRRKQKKPIDLFCIKQILKEKRHPEEMMEEMKILSIVDFFCERLNLEYEEEESLLTFIKGLTSQQNQWLGIEPNKYPNSFLAVKTIRMNQHLDWNKNLYRLYRVYSEYLGQNAVDYLNKQMIHLLTSSSESHQLFPLEWCQQLGLLSRESLFKLSMNDVLDLISLVIFTKCEEGSIQADEKEKLICLEEVEIPESELIHLNEYLPQAAIYYFIAKNIRLSHHFFLDNYIMTDQISITTLQYEISSIKKESKQAKEMIRNYKNQLNKTKAQIDKEIRDKTKILSDSVLTLARENDRLRKQLQEKEDQYKDIENENEHLKMLLHNLSNFDLNVHPVEIDIQHLNTPEIMIVGGASSTIQRLKQLLPNCKYFEVDKKYNDQYFKGVKSAILLTNILNHAMTKKLEKHCPNILKKSVSATNIDRILKEMAEFHLKN